jgi:hypothetical protein
VEDGLYFDSLSDWCAARGLGAGRALTIYIPPSHTSGTESQISGLDLKYLRLIGTIRKASPRCVVTIFKHILSVPRPPRSVSRNLPLQ